MDQNLSPRVIDALRVEFPGSMHVRDFQLERAPVWEAAMAGGYTIVSKDADFHQMSFLRGAPPKVVWLRVGNCSTERIIEVLQARAADLRKFHEDAPASFLVIS